jgi:hypothetical protein
MTTLFFFFFTWKCGLAVNKVVFFFSPIGIDDKGAVQWMACTGKRSSIANVVVS